MSGEHLGSDLKFQLVRNSSGSARLVRTTGKQQQQK